MSNEDEGWLGRALITGVLMVSTLGFGLASLCGAAFTVLALPDIFKGGPETAHHIFNSSQGPLKFLAVSTMMSPEIAEYPDSGKIGFYHARTDAQGKPAPFRHITREGQAVPYWDGE